MILTQSGIVGRKKNILPYINVTKAFFFHQIESNAFNLNNFVPVGTVLVNNNSLDFVGTNYFDTTYKKYDVPVTWDISGNEYFPALSYTNIDSIPVYNGYGLLPDTIFTDQDISVVIDNYSAVTNVEVSLQNVDNQQTIKKSINELGEVSFSQSDLTNFFSGNSKIFIMVDLKKINTHFISGKKITFMTNYCLLKNLIVVDHASSARIGR